LSTKTKFNKRISLKVELIVPATILFIFFSVALSMVASFTYSNKITQLTINQIKTMSQQVLSNYDTYFEGVIAISQTTQSKIDNIDLNSDKEKTELISYFDEVMLFKNEILNMSIYDLEGNNIASNSKRVSSTSSANDSWLEDAKRNPLINIFSRVEYTGSVYEFTLSKYVSFNKGLDNGVLKIDFDFNKIVNLIAQTDLGEGGHITIYDRDYNIVYASNHKVNEEETAVVKELVMGIKSIKLDRDYILFASTITNTTWRVAILSNNETLNATLNSFFVNVFTCTAIVIVIFVIFMIVLGNSIVSPLTKLQKEMIKVENLEYNIEQDFQAGGNKEIQNLGRSFNQMMKRIKKLMQELLEEKEEQRKSELKVLQNQINPHFLYNTFDSIIYLIDENENEKAGQMIVALSKFFRISVSKGKTIIPIDKEFEHAKYYLQIQKIKYGENFDYEINLDKDLHKYYVIKLILQPIIENAILHGISEMKFSHGLIKINGYLKDDLIHLEVIDNGYGILPQRIKEIYKSFEDKNAHNGVGIKNVYERLKIYYGEKANIIIESELDVGTKISILIPIEGALNNEEK
jgi:two-component system, sensor histidine kinase YesM